jgi:hypothetical protein
MKILGSTKILVESTIHFIKNNFRKVVEEDDIFDENKTVLSDKLIKKKYKRLILKGI